MNLNLNLFNFSHGRGGVSQGRRQLLLGRGPVALAILFNGPIDCFALAKQAFGPGPPRLPPSAEPWRVAGRVKRIIQDQLDVKPTASVFEARLIEDLHADALDFAQISSELEKVFGVEIPDEVQGKWYTVGDVIEYIAFRVGGSIATQTSSPPPISPAGEYPEPAMPKAPQTELGIVKWFNPAKHFGFLTRVNADEDVIVFESSFQKKDVPLIHEGKAVQFEVIEGPKGWYADKVRFLPEAQKRTNKTTSVPKK